jgi:Ca-activated chloride channel family protein
MTDGDFNVGISDAGELTRLIEERAKSGVFLSVLGFGMGNLKDSTMERLADKGNGHYAYIDTLAEARKVLVEQMSATLVTVAKDVKIQVDFNPAKVEAYRLIGYENRALRPEDFNDDRKDAGEMGAGHTVTALFEIVPRGGVVPGSSIDPSVFQPAPRPPAPPASRSNDLLVLRMRYKLPEASESTRMDVPFADRSLAFAMADDDFRFAAAVAAFGMLLRDSPYKGDATLKWVWDTASASQGKDQGGYRDEFVSLVQKAIALSARTRRVAP